jgi:drug/metabolite transporter (DMT)-like permease
METIENQKKQHGLGLAITAAILASILFSGKGILTKAGMAYGVSALEMLALRLSLAAPLYAGILFWSLRKRPIPLPLFFKSIGLGLLGCYVCPTFNFYGLQTVSASLERVLIHAIPAMVLLISWFKGREMLSRKTTIALAICYIGVAMSCLGRDGANARADLIGVTSILFGCLLYAYFLIESVRVQNLVGVVSFTSAAMLGSATVCCIQSIVTGHSQALFSPPDGVFPLAIALAVLCTVFPAYLSAYGLKMLGASRTSVLNMFGPLLTPIIAALTLGENMSSLQMGGFALVFAGGIILSRKA